MNKKQAKKLVAEQDEAGGKLAASRPKQVPARPGRFVKGDPRINRTLGPKPKNGATKDDAEAELLESLGLMKRVLQQDKTQDRTNQERHYRTWLEESLSAFMAKKAELERVLLAREPEGGEWDGKSPCPVCKREPEGVDEGVERIKQLREDFLREMNQHLFDADVKKAAELAARPDGINIAVSLQKELTACLKREARLQRALDDLRAGGEGRIIFTNPEDEAIRHPLDRSGWGG